MDLRRTIRLLFLALFFYTLPISIILANYDPNINPWVYPVSSPVIIQQPSYNYPVFTPTTSVSTVPNGLSGENEFNGFEDIPWGIKLSEINKELQFVETIIDKDLPYTVNKYILNDDPRLQLNLGIESVFYLFYDEQFYAVEIKTKDFVNFCEVATLLSKNYGYHNNYNPALGIYRDYSETTYARGLYSPKTKEGLFELSSRQMNTLIYNTHKDFFKKQEKKEKEERKQAEKERKEQQKQKTTP